MYLLKHGIDNLSRTDLPLTKSRVDDDPTSVRRDHVPAVPEQPFTVRLTHPYTFTSDGTGIVNHFAFIATRTPQTIRRLSRQYINANRAVHLPPGLQSQLSTS